MQPDSQIAVIGWGSLIWCPGSLAIESRWRSDGPKLPLEFARISQDGRLTLVLLPSAPMQGTYWATCKHSSLELARENLRQREGTNIADIHFLNRTGDFSDRSSAAVIAAVSEWLKGNAFLSAVIWTGLPSNWPSKRDTVFTDQNAILYLEELEATKENNRATYTRAREYVVNAPPLINTPVRRAMRSKGWRDAQLPDILFDSTDTRN